MLLIYSSKVSSRSRYIFDWVFEQWGIKYTHTENIEEFVRAECPKILYSKNNDTDCNALWVGASSDLLYEETVTEKKMDIDWINDIPFLFPNESDAGFDFFGAVFFMLSRYEEYLPFQADAHGRFPANESVAFKNGFLERPVVDLWLNEMQKRLDVLFPQLEFRKMGFRGKVTYDIDTTFKYLGRSGVQNLLAAAKDLISFRWKNLAERVSVLVGSKKDPWDCYAALQALYDENKCETVFFFLGEYRTQYDRNLSFDHKMTKKLLREISAYAEVGLHPSYFSGQNADIILKEKKALERKSGHVVESSRQHFLKFTLPYTFNYLRSAGIRHEYSMFFPDAPGFRAGTSLPFYFYDLKSEKQTDLKLFPGCWMDSTFIHYLNEGAETAYEKAMKLMTRIEEVGGAFIPVFHNNNLADPAWFEIHAEIVKQMANRTIK